ncbi:MAG: HDOD domain-containing protein [Spirochaetes bacterium]|nr:HDOD domain-containing protein [Spirochaetota bacterium]
MNESLNEEKSRLLWKKILAEAENMPTLPDIVNKVLEQIENPNSNPDIFKEIISQDPMLTAKVLKMSNSAYYGFSREIVTLSEAIIILGLDTLKSLVIAASAFKSLNQQYDGYGLSKGDLWKHSLATAVSATLITKIHNYQDTEKFFVAGLLHDIGKIVLSKTLEKYNKSIATLVKMREISFDIAEREVLGFNHCDVGAELARYWKLPELFVDVSKHHHTPDEAFPENGLYVKVIHIADMIAYDAKLGLGVDGSFYKRDRKIFQEFKIDRKTTQEIIPKVRTSIREFEKALI